MLSQALLKTLYQKTRSIKKSSKNWTARRKETTVTYWLHPRRQMFLSCPMCMLRRKTRERLRWPRLAQRRRWIQPLWSSKRKSKTTSRRKKPWKKSKRRNWREEKLRERKAEPWKCNMKTPKIKKVRKTAMETKKGRSGMPWAINTTKNCRISAKLITNMSRFLPRRRS